MNALTDYQAMIYLISCLIHNVSPDEAVLSHIDLSNLLSLSQKNMLTIFVYEALKQTNLFSSSSEEIRISWTKARNSSLRRSICLDRETRCLFDSYEKAGIWYMPLKGIILKQFYPSPAMREMADLDILYDDRRQDEVQSIMLNHGYEAVAVGISHHDIYHRLPFYNCELHSTLFDAEDNAYWQKYSDNPQDYLIKQDPHRYQYDFKDEDLYLYLVVHARKHYRFAGFGLRTLLDFYLFLRKKDSVMNWSYIHSEAQKVNVTDFEKQCRTLAMKLFDTPFGFMDLNTSECRAMQFVADSGVNGSIKNLTAIKLDKESSKKPKAYNKLKYVFHRLFPSPQWMKLTYTKYRSHPWLLPFYYFYRIFKALFTNTKKVLIELHFIFSSNHTKNKEG